MRKYFGIIILAILVSSITLSVNAQDNKTTSKKTVNSQTFRGPNFVDKNNDGVCDNIGKNVRGTGRNFIDKNNDGICDNIGKNVRGAGSNFIDKNNDGVCDNYGKWKNSQRGKCWANGNGKGNRRGRGRCNGNGNGNGRR